MWLLRVGVGWYRYSRRGYVYTRALIDYVLMRTATSMTHIGSPWRRCVDALTTLFAVQYPACWFRVEFGSVLFRGSMNAVVSELSKSELLLLSGSLKYVIISEARNLASIKVGVYWSKLVYVWKQSYVGNDGSTTTIFCWSVLLNQLSRPTIFSY
jgi:hypothetical protein